MATDDNPVRVRTSHLPSAQSVIEAGGAISAELTTAIAQRILVMLPGDVLEVVSLAPTATVDIAGWCHGNGHELLGMVADGDESSFWIRKRA